MAKPPKKSLRPKARPFKDVSPRAEEGDQEHVKKKKPVAKKAKGGSMTARGMGAAKKGGKFSRAG